jgi:hypothetical protein
MALQAYEKVARKRYVDSVPMVLQRNLIGKLVQGSGHILTLPSNRGQEEPTSRRHGIGEALDRESYYCEEA